MKKRIALFLAAVLAVSALAGCAKKETPSGGETTKPADKQEVTLNLGSEPPNMDSTKTDDQVSFEILANVEEGLTRQGAGGKILPGLATDWKVENDVNYTFNLRKDVKWSDGQPLKAQDFVTAWLHVLDPQTAALYSYQLYYIKGGEAYNSLDPKAADYATKAEAARKAVAIQAVDDYTVKVTLDKPTPYFLSLMAFPTYFPVRQDILTKYGDKYAADPSSMVYVGPFTISEWVHDDHITLVKNPSYYDAKNIKLEKLNLKMIKDSNTAIQMYETNEFDATGVPGSFLEKYKTDKNFVSEAQATAWYLTVNLKDKILSNKNIRKALSLAIDRKGFVDNVMKNGSIPADGLIPGSIAGADGKNYRAIAGSMIKTSPDAAAAKAAWDAGLKELGMTKVTLNLMGGDTDIAKKYLQGLQEMLQTTLPGLTLNLEPLAFKVRLDRTQKGEFQLVHAGWGADYNDPMTFMDMWMSDNPHNDAKWNSKAYDDLIKKAQTDANLTNRVKYFTDAEKLMMDELPLIPLYFPATNRVSKPWYKGTLYFSVGADIDWRGTYIEGKAAATK